MTSMTTPLSLPAQMKSALDRAVTGPRSRPQATTIAGSAKVFATFLGGTALLLVALRSFAEKEARSMADAAAVDTRDGDHGSDSSVASIASIASLDTAGPTSSAA